MPIEETAALMGHADISITAKYYVEISADRKKTALDKIADFTLDIAPDPNKERLNRLITAFNSLNDSEKEKALQFIETISKDKT